MKNTLLIFIGLIILTSIFLGSCIHEIPHDFCSSDPIALTIDKTDASGNQNNGKIVATATGGSDFQFSLNGASFTANGTFGGLRPNTIYQVVAKNAWGCTDTAQIEIGLITAPNPCAGVNITVNCSKTNPGTGQSNGSITATATGSTGFAYSINNGTFQTSGNFTGLAAGNYIITAKNANGCTGVTTVALGASNSCTGVTITVSATKVDPSGGQNNGSIAATATGGTGFTYSINNGTYQTSGNFTGLATGTYTVSAKSAAGCIGSTSVTLAVANSCTNNLITITNSVVNVMPCASPAANGKITVSATGSSGYTYNINGGVYQASNIFPSLAAGTFTIGVKDANGCTKTASVTVGTAVKGPMFTAMRNFITTRCGGSGCHMNGSSKAGYNFDTDCSIVTAWSAIRTSCVTSNSMPKSPQAPMTTAERTMITNWVNAGHTYGN